MGRVSKLTFALLLFVVLPACGEITPSGSVNILSPIFDEPLPKGEMFEVEAVVDVNYTVAFVEIRLWDVSSDYHMTWLVDYPLTSKSFAISELLGVPSDAPTGNDYRLQVSVAKRNFGTNTVTTLFGYSQKVQVLDRK